MSLFWDRHARCHLLLIMMGIGAVIRNPPLSHRRYQRRRGELQSVGEMISAALEAAGADPRFYSPRRQVKPGATLSKNKSDPPGDVQLELNFNPNSPERPLEDLFPEAYS